ncbi:hypothetical protein [Chryseobacterium sp.]|uniref:hypothetical protein n=1 Tax=Chryseobacterium sp. TaxID=1871047 RepID=UPI0028A00D98|nr:hypothetical protein [Chryseobacterium sp.]
MSFKLLAIRPLKGCNPKFLKNLEEGRIYKFYNDYKFFNGEDRVDDFKYEIDVNSIKDVERIDVEETLPKDFFGKNINISAIVGKNGSGKSALVELLVASIVKIALEIKPNFIDLDNIYKSSERKVGFQNSLLLDLKNINTEFFFVHNAFPCIMHNDELKCFSSLNQPSKKVDKIRRIVLKNGKIKMITDFIRNGNVFIRQIDISRKNLKSDQLINHLQITREELHFFQNFFYTMVINYSHYAFNNLEQGEWLRGVFHKNDGYQLPIVINPYRSDGNIDINSEKYLASSRFLVNILQDKFLRQISEEKEITHISVELDSEKFFGWDKLDENDLYDWDKKYRKDKRLQINDQDKENILKWIAETFSELKLDINLNKNKFLYPFVRDYILLKLVKMRHYPIYKDFKECFIHKSEEFNVSDNIVNKDRYFINNKKLIKEYIKAIAGDLSHTTDKFRQALFFLKFIYINKNNLFKKDESELLLSIDELFERVNKNYLSLCSEDPLIIPEELNRFTISESLPSFFKINYFFDDEYSDNNFNNFSSGEKQKIFSIHSVIYHLRNLKSVMPNHNHMINGKKREKILIGYCNVTIIFDEIELYAHPEFQRKYLNDLLKALNSDSIHLENKNINIIFITHSPFILSDIPKQNVLFIDNGNPEDFKEINTFGANITDLLAEGFFFAEEEDGKKILMGDFAKNKINEVINIIKEKNGEKKELAKRIIELIGEHLLKNKLNEMYYKSFDSEKLIQLEMTELERLAKKYNKKIQ